MDIIGQVIAAYGALGLGLIGTLIAIIIIIVLVSWAIFWFLLPFYIRHISKTLEVTVTLVPLICETLIIIKRQQEITNELLAKIVQGAPPPPNNIEKDEPKIKSEPSGMIIVPKGSR